MNIISPKTRVNLSVEKLFEMSSDGRNFARYFSNQVKDIDATEESCTFTVENVAKITLRILEKTPYCCIRFTAENDKNIPFFLTFNYSKISENETDVEVEMDIDLPLFLKPVLQKPLQRFIDTLSEKIKTNAEILGT